MLILLIKALLILNSLLEMVTVSSGMPMILLISVISCLLDLLNNQISPRFGEEICPMGKGFIAKM